MNAKYDKLCGEIAKLEKKSEDIQVQLKELYDKRTEMENLEIINTVRAMVMDKGQCQRRLEIVRKRRRNFVVFRRGGGGNKIKRFLAGKEY